jgi:hypothetical protein
LGGATATAPAGGFQSSDLSVYFAEHVTAARSPTRSIPTSTSTSTGTSSSKLSTGAIAGIAVGGAVVLIAILLGGCCLIRRHRRRHMPQPPVTGYPAPDYFAVPQSPYNPQSQYQQHYQPPMPVQQTYQLPAVVPVELQGNNYQMDPTKNTGIQQLPAEPIYLNSPNSSPQPQHLTPTHSVHSPVPSYFSPTTDSRSNTMYSAPGSATSPTPTYSSVGRHARKPVPANQTYYSP